jgi:hypothetical protein
MSENEKNDSESSLDDWETCDISIILGKREDEITTVDLPEPIIQKKEKREKKFTARNIWQSQRLPKPVTGCTKFVDALKKADKYKGIRGRNYGEILRNKTNKNMSYEQLCKKIYREKDPATGHPI